MLKQLPVIALAGIAAFATPSEAVSFKCSAATETAERVICGNAKLSSLDDRLATLYNDLMQTLDREDQRDGLRDYQRRFLATRDACGSNRSCIKGAYLDQIEVLKIRLRYADNGWLR